MSKKRSESDEKEAELKRLLEIESDFSGISPNEHKPPFCSFCGKGKDEYKSLVAGPSANICDECIIKSVEILIDENGDKSNDI